MDFGILVKFMAMAERYDTIAYSKYDPETCTAHVYFAHGEEWVFQARS